MLPPKETAVNPGLHHYLHLERSTLYRALQTAIDTEVKGQGLRVLDVGCGWKKYEPLFAGKAAHTLGIEPGHGHGCPDALARGEALPFRENRFDTIICTQVVQYFDDPFQAVKEMHRVLKKNGVVFLSGPGTYPLFDPPNPKWRFVPDGFRRLFTGFSRVEVRPLGGFLLCYFQILNLFLKHLVFRRPWENGLTKRVMWWLVFPLLNTLGKALDALLPHDKVSIGYLVIARK